MQIKEGRIILCLVYLIFNITVCENVMQHIKRGTLQVKSILSFVFDVLELFLSFKMTPHLSNLIKAFKVYK